MQVADPDEGRAGLLDIIFTGSPCCIGVIFTANPCCVVGWVGIVTTGDGSIPSPPVAMMDTG